MTARQGRRVLRPREAVHPWHEPARAGRSEEVAWGVGPSIRVVDFSLFVSRHASVTSRDRASAGKNPKRVGTGDGVNSVNAQW